MRAPLYMEDLSVGQRFVTGTATLDEAAIIRFAVQFDPQPFHTDPVAAKGSIFGGLVASGWHTASITMRLQADSGPPLVCDAKGAVGMIGAGCEVVWPLPVRPGDRLRVESEVLEIVPSRSRPDRGKITLRSETRNQKDETVQVLTAKLLVWKRPL